MGKFFGVAVCLLAVSTLRADTPGQLNQGKQVYSQRCAGCHGSEGAGGAGPSLKGKFKHGNTHAEVRKVIEVGIPGTMMPGLKLPEPLLNNLTSYVLSLQKTKAAGKKKA